MPEKVYEALPDLEAMASGEIPGYNKSYLSEIITLVAIHHRKEEGESHLKMTYMRKIIPNAEKYIRYLVDLGVIIRKGSYKIGKISYSYKFTEDYYSRYKYFPIEDQRLIRKLHKNNLKKYNSHKFPGQNFYTKKLTILPDAIDYIKNWEDKKYNAALTSILKILQPKGEGIYFSVDKTAGRYHSNLTNLQSDLRQFIRIEGQQLSNVDIANSQPYFSTLLLTDPGKVSSYAKSKELSMLLKTLQSVDTLDSKMYVYLTVKGKFYEFFWQKLRESGLVEKYPVYNDQVKKYVKNKVFVILFGPSSYWSREHEIFEKWFPSVYEQFTIVKGHSRGDKFTSYKRYAILLQSMESFIVNDVIVKRINREYPGVITTTIYDSVQTSITTNEVEIVSRIMTEELTGVIGFNPNLKIEKFSSNLLNTSNNNTYREREGGGTYSTNTVLNILY